MRARVTLATSKKRRGGGRREGRIGGDLCCKSERGKAVRRQFRSPLHPACIPENHFLPYCHRARSVSRSLPLSSRCNNNSKMAAVDTGGDSRVSDAEKNGVAVYTYPRTTFTGRAQECAVC